MQLFAIFNDTATTEIYTLSLHDALPICVFMLIFSHQLCLRFLPFETGESDLVVAIEIGMVLACLLFIKRMSEETHVNSWTYVDDDTPDVDEHLQKLPLQIRVYEISGPLFFGAASAIEHIVVKDFTTCLVLRMRSVPALDSTAMNALVDLVEVCESKGITVVFSHVNEQPMKVMEKAGFTELVGKENFQPNISAALKRAEEVIAK